MLVREFILLAALCSPSTERIPSYVWSTVPLQVFDPSSPQLEGITAFVRMYLPPVAWGVELQLSRHVFYTIIEKGPLQFQLGQKIMLDKCGGVLTLVG